MYQDYPFFAPGQEAQQGIRVQLAALIACLRSGVVCPADEINPYMLPEEDDGTTVHQFIWVHPSGRLAHDVEEAVASMGRAILRRDLEPLLLVIELDDEIDSLNSWLSATDFERWCEQRTIELGEWWSRFLDEPPVPI